MNVQGVSPISHGTPQTSASSAAATPKSATTTQIQTTSQSTSTTSYINGQFSDSSELVKMLQNLTNLELARLLFQVLHGKNKEESEQNNWAMGLAGLLAADLLTRKDNHAISQHTLTMKEVSTAYQVNTEMPTQAVDQTQASQPTSVPKIDTSA